VQYMVMHHVTYRLYPVDATRIDGVDDVDQPRQHKKDVWQRWKQY